MPIAEIETLPPRRDIAEPPPGYTTPGEVLLDSLPTPPEVIAELQKMDFSDPRERKEVEEGYKLSALFGGQEVACHYSDRGLVILRSGTIEQMAEWLQTISDWDLKRIDVSLLPPEWKALRRPEWRKKPWWRRWF